MKVQELLEKLPLNARAGIESGGKKEITGGICSDLLSYVMANAKENNLWVTIQTHQNIIAVATLLGLSCIIIAGGVEPNQDTLEKAEAEGIPVLTTSLSAFDFIVQLSTLMN